MKKKLKIICGIGILIAVVFLYAHIEKAHEIYAVSYTHLDVYKRQTMECEMHCIITMTNRLRQGEASTE